MLQAKGEKTRNEIIECAKNLFYHKGFEATSFSDIVAAAQVNRGNIYHHFKSKDDILRAVVDQRLQEFAALLTGWERRLSDPRERLIAFVHMVVSRQDELARYGCPIGSLNTELGKDRPLLQREARRLFDLFRDWLARQLALSGTAGNSQVLALHLLGRAQGIALIAHVYGDRTFLLRETAELEQWLRRV